MTADSFQALRDPSERDDEIDPEAAWKELRPLLPAIRMLAAALAAIGEANPERFMFHGIALRGEKRVYASAANHDPVEHFPRGRTRMCCGFLSFSESTKLMSSSDFCGHGAQPRTVFHARASSAYCIKELSCRLHEDEVSLLATASCLDVTQRLYRCCFARML